MGVATKPELPPKVSEGELRDALMRIDRVLQRVEPLLYLAEKHPLIYNLLRRVRGDGW